jgi:hypothetical protein
MKWNKNNEVVSILLLLLSSFLIVFGAYNRFFSNDYLLQNGGDGLKHYYSFSYFIKYGNGWNFDGVAYPYGENLLFLDGHGIFAKCLHYIHHNWFELADYSVGILHIWLFSFIIITPFFLFKILKHFNFKNWEAIIAALLIFALSPQWHRLDGHQSLSYLHYIPMIWWFMIKIMNSKKQLFWAILFIISVLFFGFIHPYYLPLAAIFALSYMLVSAIQNRKIDYKTSLVLSLIAIIPLLVFQLYMGQIDNVGAERGYVAGGFFQYAATFEGVFIPNFGAYFDFWHWLTNVKGQSHEAYNYVGFIGQIVLLVLVFQLLKKLFSKNFKTTLQFSDNKELNAYLYAGILILLFALVIIFQWFPQLLEHVSILRAFRSSGRFGWIFYYIFTVFSAYKLKNWLVGLKLKNSKLAIGLFVLSIGIWAIEGFINVSHQSKHVNKNYATNLLLNPNYSNALKRIKRNPTDFQAIIPVPVFHAGSDKLNITGNPNIVRHTFLASYQLHFPFTAYYSSRVPMAKSLELLRWQSDDLTRLESDFEHFNEKPFLIVCDKTKLDEDAQRLISRAKLIYTDVDFLFYELDINEYKNAITERQNTIKEGFENKENLYQFSDSIYTTDSTKAIYFNGFNDRNVDWKDINQPFGNQNFFGRGNRHLLFEGKLPKDSVNQKLEISIWVYTNDDMPSMPILKCYFLDENDNINERYEQLGMYETHNFGRWVRIDLKVPALDKNCEIYLGYYNNFRIYNYYADNFLIRPKAVDVYIKTENLGLTFNGYLVK